MYVVVLDDAELNVLLVVEALRDLPGIECKTFTDPRDALTFSFSGADIALFVVDYDMPGMNGIEFTQAVLADARLTHTPVVMITSFDQRATRRLALGSGVIDFLTKPFDPIEVRARVKNLLSLHDARRQEANRAEWLAREVAKAVRTVEEREREIVMRLVMAVEYRDTDTGLHVQRVAGYVELIAKHLGLDASRCRALALAATMHDIGKIAIPDAILLKNGPLDAEERSIINRHPEAGFAILKESSIEVLQVASEIALTHHERWDGSGYPRQLAGETIPLAGRITAVADTFDALVTERPYKRKWTLEEGRDFLVSQSGRHFDPRCVDAFLADWDGVESIVAMTSAQGWL